MLKWILILFLVFPVKLEAQDSTRLHSVFAEIGGVGVYGSVNYERIFPLSDKWKLGARVGLSTLKFIDFNGKFNPDLILPLGISAIFGQTHCAEVGIINVLTGINEFEDDLERTWSSNGSALIGYRYNAKRNPLYYKCFYSPMLIRYEQIIHWGGLGIGYRF